MANNVEQFSFNVEQWSEKAKEKGERMVRALILGLYRDVILATPVDTGRARSNWVLSVNTPNRGTSEVTDAGSRKGAHSGRSKAMTMVADAKLKHMGEASRVFVSNSVPYIGRLEEGHSPQNKSGIVKPAIERLKKRVEALGTY